MSLWVNIELKDKQIKDIPDSTTSFGVVTGSGVPGLGSSSSSSSCDPVVAALTWFCFFTHSGWEQNHFPCGVVSRDTQEKWYQIEQPSQAIYGWSR